MRILIILSIIALSSVLAYTYEKSERTIPIEIDEPLIKYVEEWFSDMEKNNIDYSNIKTLRKIIITTELDSDIGGISNTWERKIKINSLCLKHGEWYTRYVVYHELGHYVFEMEHNSCFIMSTSIPLGENFLISSWETNLTEYLNLAREKTLYTTY
jgi:predicted metal-dependent hydrolase